MTCSAESGTCARCQSGCTHHPGWFLPGEAEKAAELLGMTLAELFEKRLEVDYWYEDSRLSPTTFLLRPAVVSGNPGGETGLMPRGVCTFYVNGRCEIHAAKPVECREWWCEADKNTLTQHVDVARAWTDHQGQIAELLGREPIVPRPTILDVLEILVDEIDRMDPEGASEW